MRPDSARSSLMHERRENMKQFGSGYCLGCGKELMDTPSFHGKAYRVCSQCAEIMQHGDHRDFFKVMKAVTRNLDNARAEQRLSTNREPGHSVWTNAIGI